LKLQDKPSYLKNRINLGEAHTHWIVFSPHNCCEEKDSSV